MKKIITIALIVAATTSLKAQVKKAVETDTKSKIEAFSDRSGSMIKKEIIDIVKVDKINFQVMKLMDLGGSSVTVSGLRIDGPGTGTYSRGSKTAFLDSDELEGFLKALNYMLDNIFPAPLPDNYVEYNYQSRSGFRTGAFKSNGKWSAYIQLIRYDGDSEYFIGPDKIKEFRDAVIAAKAKL